jgi:endonuclease YncB( thermonuclease family)
MQRRGSYIAVGSALLVLALVFARQQQNRVSAPPRVGTGNSSVAGIQIPEPSCSYFSVPGREFPAQVTDVRDADDLVVTCRDNNGAAHRVVVRLAEIDCPEWGQPYHDVAKRFLSENALGKSVVVKFREINDYRWSGGICRIVGWVRLPDGSDVSRLLLRRGLAWHFEEYSDNKDELNAIQQQARAGRLGLWAEDRPISPWDYRRGVRR